MPQEAIRLAIGNRLRKARDAVGLTQADVATHMLRTRQTVSAWERGVTPPNIYEIRELALLYRATTDEILVGVHNLREASAAAIAHAARPLPGDVPAPAR